MSSRRITGYVTIYTTQKTDKKTSKRGQLFIARCLSILLGLLSFSSTADVIAFKDSPATQHIVVKGDTLWDISAKFLRDPWKWPAVWQQNKQIDNPHLIYPGDVISLCLIDGQQTLCINQQHSTNKGNEKWSPKMRESNTEQSIAIIPLEEIRPFLMYPMVLSKEKIDRSGYIVHLEGDRLISDIGTKIYVRNIHSSAYKNYIIFQPSKAYKDPETDEILGYEALYLGNSRLIRFSDPSTLIITQSVSEIHNGERLTPLVAEEESLDFFPKAPKKALNGQIISVLKGIQKISQYDIVVLNKGTDDGFKRGYILDVIQQGKIIADPYHDNKHETIKLPNEKAGLIMIFRTFKRVSYALVMQSTKVINLLDSVQTPTISQ